MEGASYEKSDFIVTIFYDSYDDTWELGAGAWWSDDSWLEDVSYSLFPYVGQKYEVGGLNGVGMTLYDLSGYYNKANTVYSPFATILLEFKINFICNEQPVPPLLMVRVGLKQLHSIYNVL